MARGKLCESSCCNGMSKHDRNMQFMCKLRKDGVFDLDGFTKLHAANVVVLRNANTLAGDGATSRRNIKANFCRSALPT